MGHAYRSAARAGGHNVTVLGIDFDYRELIVSTIKEWKAALTAGESDEGHTAAELATALGISARTMERRLRAGVRDGRYLVGKATRTSAIGSVVTVPVYRLAEVTA